MVPGLAAMVTVALGVPVAPLEELPPAIELSPDAPQALINVARIPRQRR